MRKSTILLIVGIYAGGASVTEFYDRDYYERGPASGKSNYDNYRWIPELTFPMAMTIIDVLGIRRGDRVLDYGCAKGFLVKAMRLLYREAWGLDISNYALENADPEIKKYCFHPAKIDNGFPKSFDFIVAKDVLEHIHMGELPGTLLLLRHRAPTMFVLVPLGENGVYRAHANNLDKSHAVCENEFWWSRLFETCGWDVKSIQFKIPGIKEAYDDQPGSHGFFVLDRG